MTISENASALGSCPQIHSLLLILPCHQNHSARLRPPCRQCRTSQSSLEQTFLSFRSPEAPSALESILLPEVSVFMLLAEPVLASICLSQGKPDMFAILLLLARSTT